MLIDPLDLWADEAWWASLLESRDLDELGFRPIGYMWLCRWLLRLGNPEMMLRLPSLVAGIVALAFIYKTGALTYRSRTAVLFVLLIAAFNPKLIVFAKEFKPYSVEIFVFSALTYWALISLRRGRVSPGLIAAALIAIPFCYPVIFLYPGIALVFAGDRLGAWRRLTTRQYVFGALVAIPTLVFVHFFLFEHLEAAQSRWFWGSKYDVFPIGTGLYGGLVWYVQKTWALFSLPGVLEGVPEILSSWFAVAFTGGVAVLIAARRYRELALFGTPLLVAAIANMLGYWPYGAFRANLFLIPGALLIGGNSLDWLVGHARLRAVSYTVIVAVLAAVVALDPKAYSAKSIAHWAPSPQLTEVLDDIDGRRRAGSGEWSDVILADWHSWRPIAFYLRDYPDLREQLQLVRGPLANTEELERQIARQFESALRESRPTRLWLVVTRLKPHGEIRSSSWVSDFAVYQRDFLSLDHDYHPVLFELHPRSLKVK